MKIAEVKFSNGMAWLTIVNGNNEPVGSFQIINPNIVKTIRESDPTGIEFTFSRVEKVSAGGISNATAQPG